MTIERAISDMTRKELEDIVIKVHEILWDPEEEEEYNDPCRWSQLTAERIADVFSDEDLHPYNLEEYQE